MANRLANSDENVRQTVERRMENDLWGMATSREIRVLGGREDSEEKEKDFFHTI